MTKEELEKMSDIDLIIYCIKKVRRRLGFYSPLGVRLDFIMNKLFNDREITEKR